MPSKIQKTKKARDNVSEELFYVTLKKSSNLNDCLATFHMVHGKNNDRSHSPKWITAETKKNRTVHNMTAYLEAAC